MIFLYIYIYIYIDGHIESFYFLIQIYPSRSADSFWPESALFSYSRSLTEPVISRCHDYRPHSDVKRFNYQVQQQVQIVLHLSKRLEW